MGSRSPKDTQLQWLNKRYICASLELQLFDHITVFLLFSKDKNMKNNKLWNIGQGHQAMRFRSDPIRLLYVNIDVIAIYTNKYCLN